jgi:hypothetical protein
MFENQNDISDIMSNKEFDEMLYDGLVDHR